LDDDDDDVRLKISVLSFEAERSDALRVIVIPLLPLMPLMPLLPLLPLMPLLPCCTEVRYCGMSSLLG
jgi:hypothetical protein